MLEINNIQKSFGGIHAVMNCSFSVEQNAIVALIGPNGAGKTTIFNLISGLIKPDQGDISFKGNSLIPLKPYHIAQQGIARTFQLIRLFPKLTILENMLLAEPHIPEQLLYSLLKRKEIQNNS